MQEQKQETHLAPGTVRETKKHFCLWRMEYGGTEREKVTSWKSMSMLKQEAGHGGTRNLVSTLTEKSLRSFMSENDTVRCTPQVSRLLALVLHTLLGEGPVKCLAASLSPPARFQRHPFPLCGDQMSSDTANHTLIWEPQGCSEEPGLRA